MPLSAVFGPTGGPTGGGPPPPPPCMRHIGKNGSSRRVGPGLCGSCTRARDFRPQQRFDQLDQCGHNFTTGCAKMGTCLEENSVFATAERRTLRLKHFMPMCLEQKSRAVPPSKRCPSASQKIHLRWHIGEATFSTKLLCVIITHIAKHVVFRAGCVAACARACARTGYVADAFGWLCGARSWARKDKRVTATAPGCACTRACQDERCHIIPPRPACPVARPVRSSHALAECENPRQGGLVGLRCWEACRRNGHSQSQGLSHGCGIAW